MVETAINSVVYNMDCMEGMKSYPDKYFDLAVVDPPYGIGIAEWDNEIPNIDYFNELFRITNNQIIWGANYFHLPHNEGWICWDKTYKYNQKLNVSAFELAWTSFKMKAQFIRYTYAGNFYGFENPKAHYDKLPNIHPTQKPVALYDWIFKYYAKPTDKILDTHLGSGSSRIAAYKAKLDFTGFELDKDYYDAAENRFQEYIKQERLF